MCCPNPGLIVARKTSAQLETDSILLIGMLDWQAQEEIILFFVLYLLTK